MMADPERIAYRASLRKAKEFSSPKALQEYLKKHPKADPKYHSVKEKEEAEPEEEEATPEQTKGRLNAWKGRFKNLSEKAQQFVEKAPKAVKHFLADDEFRKHALTEATSALKKAPKKLVKRLLNTAREEVKEFKEAAAGVKSVMTGKKMSKEQKKAFRDVATHIGLAAGAAAFAASGPLMGAGLFGKGLATHVAAKAVTRSLANLHLLGEAGHIVHGVAKLMEHIAAEDESVSPEEAMTQLIMASVAKEIDNLTDDDFKEVLEKMEPEKAEKKARVVRRYLKEF
jgi:HEPN domain-containing protein